MRGVHLIGVDSVDETHVRLVCSRGDLSLTFDSGTSISVLARCAEDHWRALIPPDRRPR